jgi:hypothetical protein
LSAQQNKFTRCRNRLGSAELIGNDKRGGPLLRREDFAAGRFSK